MPGLCQETEPTYALVHSIWGEGVIGDSVGSLIQNTQSELSPMGAESAARLCDIVAKFMAPTQIAEA